ncbi:MAG TPA: DUF3309 domain-containing protein [Legionella sp.]|nr:DUF3309 domain-containing protein [Legionella sp.]
MIAMIILIAFIIGLLGVLPWWGYSRDWGYRPFGIVGIFMLIYVLLLVIGRVPIVF